MKKYYFHILFFVSVALFAILLFSAFPALVVKADDIGQPPREPFKYRLMVPLPTPTGTVATTTGIVDYIKTLYLFAMGIAGVIAMAMIIYAGFRWATAGGNYAAIGDAKNRISNAILGLVLLLAAYLILNTINPSLVHLKEPLIYFINWDEKFATSSSATAGGTPDYCTDANITSCSQYSGPFYNDCLSNPCGVPGNCYYNGIFLCRKCDVNNCSEYISNESCTADPCGVGPCVIGGGGACKNQ